MNRLLMSLLLCAASASAAPKAPDFKLAEVVNAPVAKLDGLKSLRGKVVYLEFWGTWCPPCVAGIPHVNRVIEAVKGLPVTFISVTNEDAAVVRPFLQKKTMKAWVGIDTDLAVANAYQVKGRPTGFLIGKNGELLGRIPPDSLNEEDIRQAVAGKFIPRPVARVDSSAEAEAVPDASLLTVQVFRSSGSYRLAGGQEDDGGLYLKGSGIPLDHAIAHILDIPSFRVQADSVPVESVGFLLKASPGDFESARGLMIRALEVALGLKVVAEGRDEDALVLQKSADSSARPLRAEKPHHEMGLYNSQNRLSGIGTMLRLAADLSESLGKPVLDETGLDGYWDFDLEWKRGSDESRDAALAAIGLRLVPARRKVEFQRVTPAAR